MQVLLWLRVGWVSQFFYELVWWPYILLLDGILHRSRGESLILSHPRQFLLLCAFSVPWWLFFEAVNLRLENWKYIGLPESTCIRWSGYAVAYATVLPAIHQTAEFLGLLGFFSRSNSPRFQVRDIHLKTLQVCGWTFLILPLACPGYFFPLIWGAGVLILEPVLYRRGWPSLLRQISSGSPGNAYRTLLAGVLCGVLWEFWNYWAGAKWLYTVPFVGNWKVFEMPILGYIGFAPFALECRCFSVWIRNVWPDWSRARRLAAAAGLAAFSLLTFHWIDRYTVFTKSARSLCGGLWHSGCLTASCKTSSSRFQPG